METVAIVGVGLIGASFGLALRKAGFSGEILGVSSRSATQAAREVGAISRAASLDEAAAQADLLYLSQPVDRILTTISDLAPLLRPGTLVTDAGSTKVSVTRRAAEFLSPGAFLGGHPMAGKETSGAAAADANLFQDRLYLLTPSGKEGEHAAEFRQWLRRIGAIVREIDAEEHDRTVAFTSHLPQLLSTVLAATLQAQDNQNLQTIHGPGLLDVTRLALSPADLWSSILSENRQHVILALDAYIERLIQARAAVQSGEIQSLFAAGKMFASDLRNKSC
jgi:prephenate dehydrogenase